MNANLISTRQDLAAFILALRHELEQEPEAWENRTLGDFLEALARWTEDMDGYFLNRGEEVPQQPTWQTLALMLRAAGGV